MKILVRSPPSTYLSAEAFEVGRHFHLIVDKFLYDALDRHCPNEGIDSDGQLWKRTS
jgi:hypothetical protein